jgi:hypothetical protein
MKLSKKQIENIACGVVKIEENDGRFRLNRFTDEQSKMYGKESDRARFYTRACCSAGVRLVFNTDSKRLFLKGVTSYGTSRTYYTFDVLVNGSLIGCIDNFLGEYPNNYIGQKFKLGEFEKEFYLGEGMKKVEVYLPFSVIVDFEEITLDDGAVIEPIKRKYKGLLFGDSITQGYDNAHIFNHYSVALSQFLNVDFINKAIGGEIFVPELAKLKDDFIPDYIVVAYGSNNWGTGESEERLINDCNEFFMALRENYPNTKIFALSPIWRKEILTEKKAFEFERVAEIIEETVSKINNAVFINGFDFLPQNELLYADYRLHPNDEGFKHYSNSLIKKICNI